MKTGYVVRMKDGQYFMGCGYGGPQHPVPYFTEDLQRAKVYRRENGAENAAKSYGGYAGSVSLDLWGAPEKWNGFLVWQGEKRGWQVVNVDPLDFDPKDYTMNNGPL